MRLGRVAGFFFIGSLGLEIYKIWGDEVSFGNAAKDPTWTFKADRIFWRLFWERRN